MPLPAGFIPPCIPTRAFKVPVGPDWIHEVKHDGYRLQVRQICDEIIAEIRRSRFVVADYTGHRGGVYYEAGFAAGRGLPVILTCRNSDMDKLHFDIRQYNCIDWHSPEELAKRLQVRIEALLGDGPLRPANCTRDVTRNP
jgi:hypothetical protein